MLAFLGLPSWSWSTGETVWNDCRTFNLLKHYKWHRGASSMRNGTEEEEEEVQFPPGCPAAVWLSSDDHLSHCWPLRSRWMYSESKTLVQMEKSNLILDHRSNNFSKDKITCCIQEKDVCQMNVTICYYVILADPHSSFQLQDNNWIQMWFSVCWLTKNILLQINIYKYFKKMIKIIKILA